MTLKENYSSLIENMKKACLSSGRSTEGVRFLAVTKKRTLDEVKEALSLGITSIGESQLQEAYEKLPYIKGIKKHMIGHVQTNKVRGVLELFDVIETVDSLKLAKEIDKIAKEKGKMIECYIEVNIADEESKSGISYNQAEDFYKSLLTLTNIRITGLMCIAPYIEAEKTRPYFKRMRILKEKLGLKNLSMGMSNDYIIAVEEGSTEVRIGTSLFGERE